MTRPATFRQDDLTRALRATVAAGLNPAQIAIAPSGELRILFAESSTPAGAPNPLDEKLLKNGS